MAGLVIFDLDGTLVDSVLDLVPALNKTTALDGLPPIPMSDVGAVVGKGALAMIARAFAFHDRPLNSHRQKELLVHFLAVYEDHVADETVFFDGVLSACDRLSDEGWKLAVCTNKYEHLARKLLEELGETARWLSLSSCACAGTLTPAIGAATKTAAAKAVARARLVNVGAAKNANRFECIG